MWQVEIGCPRVLNGGASGRSWPTLGFGRQSAKPDAVFAHVRLHPSVVRATQLETRAGVGPFLWPPLEGPLGSWPFSSPHF